MIPLDRTMMKEYLTEKYHTPLEAISFYNERVEAASDLSFVKITLSCVMNEGTDTERDLTVSWYFRPGENFTDIDIEEDTEDTEDTDPIYTCSVCYDKVSASDLREHAESHNPNARGMDWFELKRLFSES